MRSAKLLQVAASLLGIAALVACGSDTTSSATDRRSPSPSPSSETPDPAECPNLYGGACLGELEAGTYRTIYMHPAISYTVPSTSTTQGTWPRTRAS